MASQSKNEEFYKENVLKTFQRHYNDRKTFQAIRFDVLGQFSGVSPDFYSFPSFFLQKSSFRDIFHICQCAQNGGPGDFGDPGLTKIIKNRVPPFCGFELHMSPTKPPMNGSGMLAYWRCINRGGVDPGSWNTV